jgi:hypothetical protein
MKRLYTSSADLFEEGGMCGDGLPSNAPANAASKN